MHNGKSEGIRMTERLKAYSRWKMYEYRTRRKAQELKETEEKTG